MRPIASTALPRPLALALCEGVIAFFTAPIIRRATLLLARGLLLFRHIAPGLLVQRVVLAFVRMEAACCRSDSPHFKFMARHLDRFDAAGTFARMRRYLRDQPISRAAPRLDAWVRIGLLGSLRHEIFSRHSGAPGVPPRLLTEAQIALSPRCDLTCEGCYTAEDRGGAAPRRDEIAFVVDEAVACGAFVVHVIGKGEPFLSPTWANELLDVIEARSHVFFTIATHAMHIDDTLAARMSTIGNLVLLVAVDGPETMHDARRGEGSYRRVHEAMERLKRHGVVFGFTCMVSAKSFEALTSDEFVGAREAAGCVVGIYSRYFPLALSSMSDLALTDEALAAYRVAFERARQRPGVALLDLDDVEQHTGCHSRAGESVYIDGITGQVSPCLRVPFAPAECRIDRTRGTHLADSLSHPFFVAYRNRSTRCPSWCGANLEAELGAVSALIETHSPPPARLATYERRAHDAAGPLHRLPVLPSEITR